MPVHAAVQWSSLLFPLFLTGLSAQTGDSSHVIIPLNCSALRQGDHYVIQTQKLLGMTLDSCDQEWDEDLKPLQSVQVAYLDGEKDQEPDKKPPVQVLTHQLIQLGSCTNLTLKLHCPQPHFFSFPVIADEVGHQPVVTNSTVKDETEGKRHLWWLSLSVGLFILCIITALVLCCRKQCGCLPWASACLVPNTCQDRLYQTPRNNAVAV